MIESKSRTIKEQNYNVRNKDAGRLTLILTSVPAEGKCNSVYDGVIPASRVAIHGWIQTWLDEAIHGANVWVQVLDAVDDLVSESY